MDRLLVIIAENSILSYYAIAFFVVVSLFFAFLYSMILPFFAGYPPLIYATGRVSGEVANFVDCLYFSAATQATVGYGDIIPNSVSGKTCSMIQGVFGYLCLAFLISIFMAKAVLKSKQFRALCQK